jgi:hypothetical protein
MAELTIFISHRSSDSMLAQRLVELFEKALKLPARQIRCTSVDGYRLPVGADTDEQLRREVFEARAFIGLITPASVRSSYVLFELGARWGAKKHLAPVLARGIDAPSLGGPLAGLNALRLDQRNHVVQLVEDIAEYLTAGLEPAASFQGAIDYVVTEASRMDGINTDTSPAAPRTARTTSRVQRVQSSADTTEPVPPLNLEDVREMFQKQLLQLKFPSYETYDGFVINHAVDVGPTETKVSTRSTIQGANRSDVPRHVALLETALKRRGADSLYGAMQSLLPSGFQLCRIDVRLIFDHNGRPTYLQSLDGEVVGADNRLRPLRRVLRDGD